MRCVANVLSKRVYTLAQGMEMMKPNKVKVELVLEVSTAITIATSNEYDWSFPLVNPTKELDFSVGLTPTPFVAKLSATFSTALIFSGKVGGSIKAEVNIVGRDIKLILDLAGGSLVEFEEGDWSQAGTR